MPNDRDRARALQLRARATQRLQPRERSQPNPDGTYGQPPEGMVFDEKRQAWTSRELMANNLSSSRGRAAVDGGLQGVTLGGFDELAGVAGGDFSRERARARLDVARRDYLGTTLGAEIAGAATLPLSAGTVRGGAAVGAGTGFLYGGLTGEGDVGERATGAGIGAGVGALAGAAAVPVTRAASWAAGRFGRAVGDVFKSNRFYRNGQITQAGREALEAAGQSADEVSDAFARHFSQLAREGADPQTAASVAGMREFGIPAYRHNVTGSADDFARFERARRGAVGAPAERITRRAADQQSDAVGAASNRIAEGFGGGEGVRQSDAAIAAMGGLRSARDASRQAASGAYDALEAAGGGVRGTAVRDIGTRMRPMLESAGLQIDSSTPNAASALRELDAIFRGAERGSVKFMDLERARQSLVRYRSAAHRGSLGSDQRAMQMVVQEFDRQVDDLMTTALTQGGDDVLRLAQRARGLWSQYRQTFQGDGAGSRFIQKMISDDASPDDVAKWLFSSGKLGGGQFNSKLAGDVAEVLGRDSQQWNMIRQAAFRQMAETPEGMAQMGPGRIANRIDEFLGSHTSRELSRELFTSKERALMKRYASALRRMDPPTGAVNPSGTSYENQRAVREAFRAVSGLLGFTAGPGGALAAYGAAAAAQGAQSYRAASGALSSRVPQVMSPAAGGRAAGGAAIGAGSSTNWLTQSQQR